MRQLHTNHAPTIASSPALRALSRVAALAASSLLLCASVASTAQGQTTTAPTTAPATSATGLPADGLDASGNLNLLAGHTTVINSDNDVKTVSTGDASIADVHPVGPRAILVTAKKPGTTQLIIWDSDERSRMINTTVRMDLASLQAQIKEIFPMADVEVTSGQGSVILRGRVPDVRTAKQIVELAGGGAADGASGGATAGAAGGSAGPKIMNFMTVAGGQQVSLQVRFAEVSRSATNALGVNLGLADGVMFAGSNIGQVSPLGIIAGTSGAAALGVPTPTPAVTQFGRAVAGSTAFDYFIQALRENNLVRILAEPNLVVTSGEEANFLAGGEFPIPVTQGGGNVVGGTSVTVEFKEFGVKLKMTPVVLGQGRIKINVAPEVSDLDFTTAVKFNGFVIPGLTSRKLNTTVELNEGQTFAIAGLLNHNISATKDVTPVLGDIPVVGALFRSVRYQKKETELVVLVTPRIVEAMNPDQVTEVPGEHWRNPSEFDLFVNQDLGGPVDKTHTAPWPPPATSSPKRRSKAAAAPKQPPALQGEYGFVEDPNAGRQKLEAEENVSATDRE